MNVRVQKIKIGVENAVVVSAKEWEKIKSALEELDDIAAIDRAVQGDDGTRYSIEEVEQMRTEKNSEMPSWAMKFPRNMAKNRAQKNKIG